MRRHGNAVRTLTCTIQDLQRLEKVEIILFDRSIKMQVGLQIERNMIEDGCDLFDQNYGFVVLTEKVFTLLVLFSFL